MSDILVTIFVGIILLVAAFGIPMLATLNQNDEITESSVQVYINDFYIAGLITQKIVVQIRIKGKCCN